MHTANIVCVPFLKEKIVQFIRIENIYTLDEAEYFTVIFAHARESELFNNVIAAGTRNIHRKGPAFKN